MYSQQHTLVLLEGAAVEGTISIPHTMFFAQKLGSSLVRQRGTQTTLVAMLPMLTSYKAISGSRSGSALMSAPKT